MPANETWDVVIVGGGAAGIMASAAAAQRGFRTLVLEKARKLGVKILMSGGTRCNITHHCSPQEICNRFGDAARFLHRAVGQLPPDEVVRIVESEGVLTKVEETGKVFPVSDRAIDVRDALVRYAEKAGAEFRVGFGVERIEKTNAGFRCFGPQTLEATFLIIACGGKSYPGCGTTGDGYAWAKALGHTIEPTHAALTPLTSNEAWVTDLSGVTLSDVSCQAICDGEKRPLGSSRGGFLFTHTGLSGPVPMNLSRYVTEPTDQRAHQLLVDWLPMTSRDQLQARWAELIAHQGRTMLGSELSHSLPRRLTESLLARLNIPFEKRFNELSNSDKHRLLESLKRTEISISGTRGFDKAEVTAGGVRLSEVDAKSMASKLVSGLFFAGEILNFDGPIGGFNFQAAFATGTLAGNSIGT